MSFLNKLFGKTKTTNDQTIVERENGKSKAIDLTKIYPRIKGLYDDKFPDPVSTKTEIELSDLDSPIIRPYADGIGICYIEDEGNMFRVLQKKDLTDNLTLEDLHSSALSNMAVAISDRTEIKGDPTNLMMVINGGNFEAAMLLADFLWEQLEPIFNDKVCVAIPANDILLIAPKNNETARQNLRIAVNQYFDNPKVTGLIVKHIYEKIENDWCLVETA